MRTKPTSNLTTLLRLNYPQVYRMAMALCSDARSANKVAWQVLRRSAAMFKTWETDADATRWFARFTVLTSRSLSASNPSRNALLEMTKEPEILAMIYAVWQLPMQQREAFLLHHGQGMELRQLATAMDCSTAAAATHLTAATKALRVLSPMELRDFTSGLPKLLEQLVPPAGQLEVQIRQVIRRRRLSAMLRYLVLWPGVFNFVGERALGGVSGLADDCDLRNRPRR